MDLSNSLRISSLFPILWRPDPQHTGTLRAGKCAKSIQRYIHRWLISNRVLNRNQQGIKGLLIHVAKELDREMDRSRLDPRDARVSRHPRFNIALQLLLDSGKSCPQLLREFDRKERTDHFKPVLFMTVRREIAEPRRETGARSSRDWL
jgi:hypothetical protein